MSIHVPFMSFHFPVIHVIDNIIYRAPLIVFHIKLTNRKKGTPKTRRKGAGLLYSPTWNQCEIMISACFMNDFVLSDELHVGELLLPYSIARSRVRVSYTMIHSRIDWSEKKKKKKKKKKHLFYGLSCLTFGVYPPWTIRYRDLGWRLVCKMMYISAPSLWDVWLLTVWEWCALTSPSYFCCSRHVLLISSITLNTWEKTTSSKSKKTICEFVKRV